MAVPLDRGAELRFGLDTRDAAGNTLRLETLLDEVGVLRIVFEMEDVQPGLHAGFLFTLPGGGSLMIAQKTPSSLMALTNSWKSTGLTT